MSAVEKSTLSRDEARSLTDEVRGDAERLWSKLVELYEGGAHVALGYGSWGSYFETEFGGSDATAYRLLQSGRVMAQLPIGSPRPATESVARELTPLLRQPEALKEAWAKVVETNESPTAADVREVVSRHVEVGGGMTNRAVLNANAEKRRIYTALAGIDGYCNGIAGLRIDRALSTATAEDVSAWQGLITRAISELGTLRRSLREGDE